MKNVSFFLVIVIVLFFAGQLGAQSRQSFSAGFHINQVHGDFGLGVSFSAHLFKDRLTLRLAGSNQWLAAFNETETEQFAYQTIRLGATNGWMVSENIRLYTEGGTMVVFPHPSTSSTSHQFGGYGLFGFEFFAEELAGSSLFLEMGGTTSQVQADLLPNRPAFGSGLLLCSGFRIAF